MMKFVLLSSIALLLNVWFNEEMNFQKDLTFIQKISTGKWKKFSKNNL